MFDTAVPRSSVSNDSTPNFLWRNRAGRLVEDGLASGVALNGAGRTEAGMGVDAGDTDGDGRLDLIVTNLSLETNTLYLATDSGFRDATRGAGLFAPSLAVLGFGVDLLDLDLDGDLDLAVANGHAVDNIEIFEAGLAYAQPNQLFANDGSGRFTDLGASAGPGFAERAVSRGLASADVDGDGRVDLLITRTNGPTQLLRNETAQPGHWLGLKLEGRGSNSQAIGALVDFDRGGRRLVEEVRAGGSYQGSSDPRLHFGLGADTSPVAELRVRWPDGATQTQSLTTLDRLHVVVQTSAAKAR